MEKKMEWEYTVETIALNHIDPTPNELLNTLGSQNWELISIVSQSANGSIYLVMFLKREAPIAKRLSESWLPDLATRR
jgi:hypothetical protein